MRLHLQAPPEFPVVSLSPRETSRCRRPVSGGGCSEVARRAFVPGWGTGVWLVAPQPTAGSETALKHQAIYRSSVAEPTHEASAGASAPRLQTFVIRRDGPGRDRAWHRCESPVHMHEAPLQVMRLLLGGRVLDHDIAMPRHSVCPI